MANSDPSRPNPSSSGSHAARRVADSLDSMRINPMKSVGTKLFAIFFFSIVIFVLAVGLMSYSRSKEVIQNKVAEASEQTIIQAGQKLGLIFSSYEDLSMQIVLNNELSRLASSLRKTNRNSYEFLEQGRLLTEQLNMYAFANKNIQSIHLMTEKGEGINSTNNSLGMNIQADQEWFGDIVKAGGQAVWLETKEKGYAGDSNLGGSSPPTFALGRLLKNPVTSEITGVLVIEIKVDVIGDQMKQIQMGEGGSTLVLSDKGNYVYHADKNLVAKPSTLPVGTDALDKEHDKLQTSDGQNQLVYFRTPNNNWILVGLMPVKELVKDAAVIFDLTLAIAFGAALIAVVIGFMLARMIGRPLIQLRNLMKEGEQGNLTVRMPAKRQDEIGQLSVSFNQMMEKITQLVQQTNRSAQEVLGTAGELSDASKKTAMSAKDIAVATEEIAMGASSLAVESERGNELTQSIGVQMKSVVEANVIMGTAAGEVQASSKQGIAYMDELIGKTNETETMTRSMVEKVDNLKESTRSIVKILDMLGNMTKQTNILSLNATIEAARAGAAGKGFMVVADEIRKLADQSRQSIAVVGQITEKIQKEIDETVQVLSQAYPIFQEQISSVKEADSIFKQVDEQMSGFIARLSNVTESISQLEASQVVLSESMTNVSAVAEESSATSQEVASLSTEQLNISGGLVKLSDKLEELSNSLKESLSKFQI
ncbi:methyl-accepting chemotaxis protein [Paenibacillus sp. cl123]|uniref:methyl-accepting chemotaxis protein n=1 Tax=Paenibacillus sp. cl123 TaxID=1761875 RepID=UPI00088371A6|nr:methyl-accepting chemotaxis protein [Paenibacillus sp. cl123]SDD01150.1 methyl-accepting chemotaxis protein [Paenibacillus sp. cl123]